MSEPVCPLPARPDFSGLQVIEPKLHLADYREALQLAQQEAATRLKVPMLLAWYDRDRNFEAPQHAGECHQASATPGYVEYALHHGASLMIDIEHGRFVFFYRDAGEAP